MVLASGVICLGGVSAFSSGRRAASSSARPGPPHRSRRSRRCKFPCRSRRRHPAIAASPPDRARCAEPKHLAGQALVAPHLHAAHLPRISFPLRIPRDACVYAQKKAEGLRRFCRALPVLDRAALFEDDQRMAREVAEREDEPVPLALHRDALPANAQLRALRETPARRWRSRTGRLRTPYPGSRGSGSRRRG